MAQLYLLLFDRHRRVRKGFVERVCTFEGSSRRRGDRNVASYLFGVWVYVTIEFALERRFSSDFLAVLLVRVTFL